MVLYKSGKESPDFREYCGVRFHYAPFLSREACAAPGGGGGWAWWGWGALEYESVSRVCPLYTFRFHLS